MRSLCGKREHTTGYMQLSLSEFSKSCVFFLKRSSFDTYLLINCEMFKKQLQLNPIICYLVLGSLSMKSDSERDFLGKEDEKCRKSGIC